MKVKYLHTMVRVKDLDASMRFYELLGLKEVRRIDNDKGRFTLVFMAPEGQEDAPVELTHNWDGDEGLPSDSRHFGHLAYGVEDIYAKCAELQAAGVTINRPPRDGHMAFVRSPGQRVGGAVADRRAAAAGRSRGRAWRTAALGEGWRSFSRRWWRPGRRRRTAGWRCRSGSTCRRRSTRASTGCRRRGWPRRWWRPRCRRRSWRRRGGR